MSNHTEQASESLEGAEISFFSDKISCRAYVERPVESPFDGVEASLKVTFGDGEAIQAVIRWLEDNGHLAEADFFRLTPPMGPNEVRARLGLEETSS